MIYFFRLLTVAAATILAVSLFYSWMVLGTGFRSSDHSHAKSVWLFFTILFGVGFVVSVVARWLMARSSLK